MWPLSNGKVHSDTSPVQLHAIGSLFCLLRVLPVLEVDEGKASRSARLLVVDNADAAQGAVLGEHFSQVSLCGVQAQAEHTQAAVRVRIRPIADVSSAVGHRGVAVAPAAPVLVAV